MNRRYFAGFQLASLHTLPLTLAICLATAVLQVGYTYFQLQNGAASFYDMTGNWMDSIFRTGLLLVGAMALTPLRGKSNFGYFLRRLQLPSSHLGFLWSANAVCCLVLFWGSQILVLWGCSTLTQSMLPPETWSHQTFLMDCYRSDFLHAVLPMNDALVWVRNFLSLTAISLACGFTVVTAWQGGQGKLACFTIIITGLSFLSAGSAMDMVMIGVYAVVVLVSIFSILNAEEDTQ